MYKKRLKETIKNSLFWDFFTFLHDTIYYPKHLFLKKSIKEQSNYLILIGTPTFNNLGDHLIAIKEREYLRKKFPDKNILEIPTVIFLRYESFFATHVSSDVEVYITGGGWMGNIWPDDEYRMQKIINCFQKNKILVFPQTVFYDSVEQNFDKILCDANAVYEKCNSLKMYFRDYQSYCFAKKNFSTNKDGIYFAPDIAMYNIQSAESSSTGTVALCLRSDREKIRTIDIKELVLKWSKEKDYTFMEFSTITHFAVPIWMREFVLKCLFNKLSKVEMVVTDRLHGMIISAISGCKCVAIDNKTHKVAGVYDGWFRNNPRVVLLKDINNKEELINCMNCLKEISDSQRIFCDEINGIFETIINNAEV